MEHTGSIDKAPRVLILFLSYGDFYKGAYEKLLEICRDISFEKRLIVIKNDHADMPTRRESDWIYHIGGDNSTFEFSGWQKGIRSEEAVSFAPDVYIFVNDAFLTKGFYSQPVIDDDILSIIAQRGLFCGNLRELGFELGYGGMKFDRYITTHFFVMSAAIMNKLGSMVSETDAAKFVKTEYAEGLFVENELWTPRFKKDLFFSITHKYHEKGRRLNPEQYGFFKRKVLCIVNEILLSARVSTCGYKLVNLAPFAGFINSHFTVYTPLTTVRPFQFLRKIMLSAAHSFFSSGPAERIGAKKWFEDKCSACAKQRLMRQV